MTYKDPNFTIITSGGCNSFCSFCTDPFKRKADPSYLKNLEDVLFNRLPGHFKQVSISGGEPTLSPDLGRILGLLKLSNRFDKVVLTTNGSKLKEKINIITKGIHHLNVSRHAIGYAANTAVFGTKEIINDKDLFDVACILNKQGIDVNLNHVYSDKDMLNEEYVYMFIEYAKSVGATSISFRYNQNENNMEETYLEKLFHGWISVNGGSCAVCRNHTLLIAGMPVVFKASYAEPSVAIDDVYELIYHITGKLTTDWEGLNEFDDKQKHSYIGEYEKDPNKNHKAKAMPKTIPKIVPKVKSILSEIEAVKNDSPEPIGSEWRNEAYAKMVESNKQPAKREKVESYGGGCSFGGGCA